MTTEIEDIRAYATTGDESAFRRIVERHAGMVRSVAFRMTQDHGLAEEITQNVFSILARKARFLMLTTLGGWLHGVAAAESRNARRKVARRVHLHQKFSETMNTEPTASASWEEIFPQLDEAVARLSMEDRELMVLRYFEKRSFREISQATGRAETACRKKAQRALERLSDLLRKRGVVAPGTALGVLISSQILAPSNASAAVIATAALQSVPASSGLTIFLTTLFYMTTQNIIKASIIALVLAAIPITYVLTPEPLPRISANMDKGDGRKRPASSSDSTSRPKSVPGPRKSDINWEEIGRKLSHANDISRMLTIKKLETTFKSLSQKELEDGLEQVTLSDVPESVKTNLRLLLAEQLAKLDPMTVLDRFPQDHDADISYHLTAGIRELAKKDSAAADQWIKTQVAAGRFARLTPGGEPAQLNLFRGAMIRGAMQIDPVNAGRMVMRQPAGDRAEVLANACGRDFDGAFREAKAYQQGTGDSTLVISLLDSGFTEFEVSLNHSEGRSNDGIFKHLSEIKDPAERARISEKLKLAESKKVYAIPAE